MNCPHCLKYSKVKTFCHSNCKLNYLKKMEVYDRDSMEIFIYSECASEIL